MATTHSVVCQRCGTPLRAVAFLDLEKDRKGEELDVYCGFCSKILEREALRSWASKWAKGIADPEHHENFFKILAAVWEQGFSKARTFEETAPVFELMDNPFIAESELIDPLLNVGGQQSEEPIAAEPEQAQHESRVILDEDDYYDANPTFGRS